MAEVGLSAVSLPGLLWRVISEMGLDATAANLLGQGWQCVPTRLRWHQAGAVLGVSVSPARGKGSCKSPVTSGGAESPRWADQLSPIPTSGFLATLQWP